jgi:hypothetical protein
VYPAGAERRVGVVVDPGSSRATVGLTGADRPRRQHHPTPRPRARAPSQRSSRAPLGMSQDTRGGVELTGGAQPVPLGETHQSARTCDAGLTPCRGGCLAHSVIVDEAEVPGLECVAKVTARLTRHGPGPVASAEEGVQAATTTGRLATTDAGHRSGAHVRIRGGSCATETRGRLRCRAHPQVQPLGGAGTLHNGTFRTRGARGRWEQQRRVESCWELLGGAQSTRGRWHQSSAAIVLGSWPTAGSGSASAEPSLPALAACRDPGRRRGRCHSLPTSSCDSAPPQVPRRPRQIPKDLYPSTRGPNKIPLSGPKRTGWKRLPSSGGSS